MRHLERSIRSDALGIVPGVVLHRSAFERQKGRICIRGEFALFLDPVHILVRQRNNYRCAQVFLVGGGNVATREQIADRRIRFGILKGNFCGTERVDYNGFLEGHRQGV